MKLRQYQREDLVKCQMDIMAGRNRNLIVWATGLGKTVLMAHIVGRLRKKRALIIVNREELVWQTVDKVRASYPELTVSVEKAEHRSTPDSEVVVASIQTIGSTREEEDGTPIFSERLKSIDPDTFDIIMVDECFVAGTLIDGRPIESIRPGDLVNSFNHEAGTEELRQVVRLFKNKPSSLMTVHLSNGQKITCTEEHPFHACGEYRPAKKLRLGEILTPYDDNPTNDFVYVSGFDIHSQTPDGTFGGMCPDGFVYNFEVEWNNNYYANGVLVHNCHRSSADSYRNVLKYFKVYLSDERYNDESKILFGLTATPNRSDNKGLNEFFNRITASRDIRWGIQNKYLTDIEAYRVETRVDISDVKITAGDFNHRQLEKKINTPARNELVISKYKEIAEGKKALFFTLDIQHAEDLAAEANKQGVKAMAVSSRTPAQTRKEIIDMHKRGELTALMSALLFCEGYDDPTVEVGCMVRPFRSGLIYRQAVGRVLRPCPAPETLNAMREAGKEPDWIKDTAIIIDFVDVSSRHNLISVPTLFGLNPKIDTKGKRLEEFTKDLENLVDKLPDKIKKKTNLEEIEDPTTLTGIIEKVDLVSIPETPQEVGKCSDMSWIKKDDTYILNMPTRTMTVRPNSMGMYDVKINMNGVSSFAGVGSTLEEAISKAEKRLTSEEKKAGSSSAAWRGNPISDKQIALLAKIDRSGVAKMNGDINKYKAVLRHSMNAGQAQALISSLLAKKRI